MGEPENVAREQERRSLRRERLGRRRRCRLFAREGAKVFLAGRTLATLEEVAEEISAAGGVTETAQVDALDEEAVEKHANAVAEKAGGIYISYNAIMNDDVQGKPLAQMPFDDFARPITKAMRSPICFFAALGPEPHLDTLYGHPCPV